MSRSNPNEGGTANPSTRWFEWNGEQGTVNYYDKAANKTEDIGSDFTFLLLDQLGSVRGWHEASKSGIYSNEVKDTTQEVLIVKAFKGGVLAEGIYRTIKDRVNAKGGKFTANCYIAFKDGGGVLRLGSIRFKGAALNAWIEFGKAHQADLYQKAIRIKGYTEDKKGRIVFRVPVFQVTAIGAETDKAATELDKELQRFLSAYLKRNKREQVEVTGTQLRDGELENEFPDDVNPPDGYEDDIPF